eukprot:SAG31_NODE_20906_length_562_cov_2.019438_1_plen_114_part_10
MVPLLGKVVRAAVLLAAAQAGPFGTRDHSAAETEEQFFAELEHRLSSVLPPQAEDDLRVAALGLRVMTMYGGTPDQLHAVSANVVRGGIDYCANKTITQDWKMKVLVHLPPVFV